MTTAIAHPSQSAVALEVPSEAPVKAGRGRPAKPERLAIIARVDVALGDDILYFARAAHLTPGEYMVKLAAEQLGMLEYIPEPMMRTVNNSKPIVRKGFYTFKALPPVPFGDIIKKLAKEMNLSNGNYMVLLAAQGLDRPASIPQIPEQLAIVKEAAQTAA